jgi:hypothetical protein
VFTRGLEVNNNINEAFNRVNSFIAGGKAAELDSDLSEAPNSIIRHSEWDFAVGTKKNKAHVFTSEPSALLHAKKLKKRNPHLTLTPVRKHPHSKDPDLAKMHIIAAQGVRRTDLSEDGKGYQNPTGGLTKKGRDHYNRQTGGHLQAPVTTSPSKLKHDSKAAGRRRSFCARMGGVDGPMKKPNGEPTRKALALRKWNCRSEDTQVDEKRGLWDNIHAKQKRIKSGSGEHMRKPGSKGAPTDAALKASQTEAANAAQQAAIAIAMKKAGKTPKNENAPCWKDYKQIGMKMKGGRSVPNCVPKEEVNRMFEAYTGSEPVSKDKNDPKNRFVGTDTIVQNYADATPGQGTIVKEATYKGKTVPLNKPMAGDVKKSKVYVDPDGDGKAKKVNFGDKHLSIKKDQPARKRSYCARSGGQGNLTNKSSANYWSRRAWDC